MGDSTHPATATSTGSGDSSGASDSALVLAGTPLVLALAALACFWGLDAGPALSDHEGIVPQCARQIRETGNWLIPYFNNEPFVRKPPLQPWLVAAASRIIDPPNQEPLVSPMAARLPSAMAGFLTVLVVLSLGRSMFTHRTALVGAGITACSAAMIFFSHNAQTEMTLTLFTTAAMACFYKSLVHPQHRVRYLLGFYVSLSVAMYAKAPMPLAVVGLPLFVYWFVVKPLTEAATDPIRVPPLHKDFLRRVKDQFFGLGQLWLLPGVALFLLITVPWPLYVYLHVEDALPLWRAEFLERYAGELGERPKPWHYYLPLALAVVAPFSLSVPESLIASFRRVFRAERTGLFFVLTWVVVDIAFLSTSPFKRPHYMLPAVPGLCLLLAPVVDRLFFGPFRVASTLVAVLNLLIVAAAVAAVPITLRFMRDEEPEMYWMATVGLPMAVILIAVICWLFWRGRRGASLLVIYLLPICLFGWIWSAMGRSHYGEGVLVLAQRMRERSIGPQDRIIWPIGRPDSRLSYYGGYQVEALYPAAQVAARRRGRLTIPPELLKEGAEKIATLLAGPEKVYFVFEAKELGMFRHYAPPGTESHQVDRVSTRRDKPGEDLIVITNPWNKIPAVATRPE